MNDLASKRSPWLKSSLALVALAAILYIGVQLIQLLPPWRMDLTLEGVYTLSEGTLEVVKSVEEPIELTFFFSASLAAEVPQFRDYARRIEDLLREYQALNTMAITVTVVDPEPFSEAEDKAVELGLQGAPLSLGGDSLYLGLAGSSADREEVISFFSPDREQFLEYDITQLIYRLKQSRMPVLGLLSSQSMMGGFDFARRQPSGPWAIIEQIQPLAEVRNLPGSLIAIDSDIDILMVVHPQDLSEAAIYAIDQYALAGGKVLLFIDPHFEGQGPAQSGGELNSSNLPRLLSAWGVEFSAEAFVADSQWGLRLAPAEGMPALPHVGVFGLREEAFNTDSVITGELETVNMASTGYFSLLPGATTQLDPLLQSSDQAMSMSAQKLIGLTNHGDLLLDFEATGERYILAANITGSAVSAFAKAPDIADDSIEEDSEGSEDSEGQENSENQESSEYQENSEYQEKTEPVMETKPHLSATADAGINIVIVGDVDILTDRLWVQVSNFFGQRVVMPWANNGDFVANAVEVLSGSDSLIGIRSRGQYTRPFTKVNELRNQAASEFKMQEQRLLEQLEQLESGIQALSNPDNGSQLIELNESQKAEVKRFEEQRLQVRKELRNVQHQLNKSIESLELKLKLINMLLMPVVLIFGMIALFSWRKRIS